MTEREILQAVGEGEARDWEFKSASGGLPQNMWTTYSAMANTDGGTIVLGVRERAGRFSVEGIEHPVRIKKSFWDTVNNRGKVSDNLLTDAHVLVQTVTDRKVLVVCVPRAARRQKPIYVGQNPLTGTYRRNFDGDYLCTRDEVGRMLADRAEEPADSRILDGFGIDDLDPISWHQYRQRISARSPDHPWLTEDTLGLLAKLGGWRRDRHSGDEGLTVAGLLMFGKAEAIQDTTALPEFHLDYRERLSDDPEVRWTDRLTIDGTWAGNLFQFFLRVIPKLTTDLKIPFRLEPSLFRTDDTIAHEAIREALVNALIHADYRGQGGIVIDRYKSSIEISNPGSLLMSLEQLLAGGISECRNKSLQTMFLMIGGGEKAGSGFDKIRQAWRSQQWRSAMIVETTQPDRVRLTLPMESLLPDESLQKLRKRFGPSFDELGPLETQAMVTAELEGEVTNSRLRTMSEEHPADLTKKLQNLVAMEFLQQVGQKRGTRYVLTRHQRVPSVVTSDNHTALPDVQGNSLRSDRDSLRSGRDSLRSGGGASGTPEGSLHKDDDVASELDIQLAAIAAPARRKTRLSAGEMRAIILQLCDDRYLTSVQLGQLLERDPAGLRARFLSPMVHEEVLAMRFPDEKNRPDQAYTTSA